MESIISKFQLGKLGENIACRHLVKNKYTIIEMNFRKPWGELDIIAKARDKTLVFIEVKTVRQYNDNFVNNDSSITAENQLTKAKLQKLQRTASLYAGHYPELVNNQKGWRIDLIALTLRCDSESIVSSPNLLTINDKSYVIKHYQNIA